MAVLPSVFVFSDMRAPDRPLDMQRFSNEIFPAQTAYLAYPQAAECRHGDVMVDLNAHEAGNDG